MDYWQPYLISLMIGLLVGVEREKAQPGDQTLGIRTFLLLSLLGAVAGGLEQIWISGLISLFTLGLVGVSYFNQTRKPRKPDQYGLTTEFAAGLIYALSYLSHQAPTLVAVTGPIVALILFSKNWIHRSIDVMKPSELEAALLLFLSAVVVINLVPDRPVDPWNLFNPTKFGYIILTLAALEFLSYIVMKFIGQKKGLVLVGFLGGIVSSTAVLLSSAKQVKRSPGNWSNYLRSALTAKIAAMLLLLLIVLTLSPPLFLNVAVPVSSAILIGSIIFILLEKNNENTAPKIELKSPLDWRGVFRLAVIFALILVVISATRLGLGESASTAASFLTGLFELHGVAVANATMLNQDQLSPATSSFNILVATSASLISKIGMSWMISPGKFARWISFSFLLMVAGLVITALLVPHLG